MKLVQGMGILMFLALAMCTNQTQLGGLPGKKLPWLGKKNDRLENDRDSESKNRNKGKKSADSSDKSDLETAEEEEVLAEKIPKEIDALEGLPEGPDSIKAICARPGTDLVRQRFCGVTPPTITSLVDLQRILGLGFNDGDQDPEFVMSAHSSSLVARFVNVVNPRAIIFTRQNDVAPDSPYVGMGFTRGEQFAEVIANDPNDPNPNTRLKFFLVRFYQACNAVVNEEGEDSCNIGELLSPAIESNWTGYTIYEDEDLKNTILDCRHCHQPAGPNSPKILRMQELQDPWTHFMRDNRNGGQNLLAKYTAAHGNETYAGIPGSAIGDNNNSGSDPARLEDAVRNAGFGNQPNEFDTDRIENDGNMQAWEAHYTDFAAGNVIAAPYHQVDVMDPVKQQSFTQSYQQFRAGQLPADQLPDLRDGFVKGDEWAMGFGVRPGSTGPQILLQACAQCHHAGLDQSLTRAKFNINLATMDKEELELAIERIGLTTDDPKRMPPHRFRDLTEDQKKTLVDHLKTFIK